MTEISGCDEKVRLLNEFQSATALYSQRVHDLAKSAGSEFEIVSRTTVQARQIAELERREQNLERPATISATVPENPVNFSESKNEGKLQQIN
jgi:hypothetical protein